MRGKQATQRKIQPDTKYGSVTLAKFINYTMYDGKKSKAENLIYQALGIVSEKLKADAIEIFETAIRNVSPAMEVKSRRVGGANYQIPIPVRGERRLSLAIRWLLGAARSRKGRSMADRLAAEFVDASKNEGAAVKKKMDVQRMAEANRAFAHFAR
jgi:small subunit ribosomal protein S7